MTARNLFTVYCLIAALAATWLSRSAHEAVKPPKWWILCDVILALFWPLGLYIWLMNTDMKWANCTTRDGWSEK